jgi:hypothetical protein
MEGRWGAVVVPETDADDEPAAPTAARAVQAARALRLVGGLPPMHREVIKSGCRSDPDAGVGGISVGSAWLMAA